MSETRPDAAAPALPPASGEPLAALVAADLVSRGDELVARRIAGVVDEPDGWPLALLALAIRAVREGSSALDLTQVSTTGAQVARADEDDVDLAVTTVGDVLAVPPPDDLVALARSSRLTAQGVVHVRAGDPHAVDGAATAPTSAAAGATGADDPPLLIMDRHDCDEQRIADLLARRHESLPPLAPDARGRADDAIAGMTLDEAQRGAVQSVLTRSLTVLTGGPGMGKTYTLAAIILAARAGLGSDLRLALAAPTGKAAARMTESLRKSGVGPDAAPEAVTLHRLLGSDRTNSQRFIHDASNPLPHDLVVVDEASMLSLAMTARLLEALKPTARLLLVGDPDQLASVEAGSVLSDLVTGLDETQIVRLTTHHRLSASRRDLALAFAAPTPDEQVAGVTAVLGGNSDDVHHLADDDVTLDALPHVAESAWELRRAAAAGDRDAALDALRHHRLLCAHRTGPYGVARWNRLIEASLGERGVDIVPGRMYVGRPIIVTKNDPSLGLFNGDTGVVIDSGGHLVVLMDRGQQTASQRAAEAAARAVSGPTQTPAVGRDAGGAAAAASRDTASPQPATTMSTPHDPASGQAEQATKRTEFSPWRLADVETMHAMTVHKAQGSQAAHVTVIVPPVGSRLLTREMLYTALTRASEELTVVGSADAIEHAVRTPVRRASGLARRLRETPVHTA